MQNIIDSFENIDINAKNEECKFILDNTVSYIKDELKLIKKIEMNFYQLWCLLGELPILRTGGKSKFEYRFIRPDLPNVIFTIYDYNNKNNFLNTNVWYLASTTDDKIINKEFLKTFLDGINCYNLFYKEKIEKRDFSSDDSVIHKNLQKIKNELLKNRDLIKNL